MTSRAAAQTTTRKPRTPRLSAELDVVYAQFPPPARRALKQLRQLIYATAAADPRIGALTETLKWGEPAFLTNGSKTGTTVRCGWKAKAPQEIAMYVHCQTNLIETFRTLYPQDERDDALRFDGNRAIVMSLAQPLPEEPLKRMIHAALTYHLNKARK